MLPKLHLADSSSVRWNILPIKSWSVWCVRLFKSCVSSQRYCNYLRISTVSYTQVPNPGICYFSQTAFSCCVWLRFPFGNSSCPAVIFELFLHPLIFSYISFSSGLLWYFLIVIHGLTSSLDMPVSVIRVVHDALCHWPLLSLSMQVFLL